ncbi:hypothetical protein NGRA_3134 [Nosema granulosis]|uniref:Uncharacterized protein n=1 Tax=Nosema granulosis TaxID=83296 RepID=A0A9P6KXG7_9MICR|nr:hypothetical protein NGRA_3134 [Nosema granulosis]
MDLVFFLYVLLSEENGTRQRVVINDVVENVHSKWNYLNNVDLLLYKLEYLVKSLTNDCINILEIQESLEDDFQELEKNCFSIFNNEVENKVSIKIENLKKNIASMKKELTFIVKECDRFILDKKMRLSSMCYHLEHVVSKTFEKYKATGILTSEEIIKDLLREFDSSCNLINDLMTKLTYLREKQSQAVYELTEIYAEIQPKDRDDIFYLIEPTIDQIFKKELEIPLICRNKTVIENIAILKNKILQISEKPISDFYEARKKERYTTEQSANDIKHTENLSIDKVNSAKDSLEDISKHIEENFDNLNNSNEVYSVVINGVRFNIQREANKSKAEFKSRIPRHIDLYRRTQRQARSGMSQERMRAYEDKLSKILSSNCSRESLVKEIKKLFGSLLKALSEVELSNRKEILKTKEAYKYLTNLLVTLSANYFSIINYRQSLYDEEMDVREDQRKIVLKRSVVRKINDEICSALIEGLNTVTRADYEPLLDSKILRSKKRVKDLVEKLHYIIENSHHLVC